MDEAQIEELNRRIVAQPAGTVNIRMARDCENCRYWEREVEHPWHDGFEEPGASRPGWHACSRSRKGEGLVADGYDGTALWVVTAPDFGCALFAGRPAELPWPSERVAISGMRVERGGSWREPNAVVSLLRTPSGTVITQVASAPQSEEGHRFPGGPVIVPAGQALAVRWEPPVTGGRVTVAGEGGFEAVWEGERLVGVTRAWVER